MARISRLATVRPELADAALRVAYRALREHGIRILWTQGIRSDEEQAALFAKGRTAPGQIVTYAATADSTPHGRGAALDFAVTLGGKPAWDAAALPLYDLVGAIAKQEGLEWGGDWPPPKTDKPHLQLPGWKALPRWP